MSLNLTITFAKQQKSNSTLSSDLPRNWERTIDPSRLQQTMLLPSATRDSWVSSAGYFSTQMADGTGTPYIKGTAAQRQKNIEAVQTKFLELAHSEYLEYGYTSPSERHLLQFATEYPGLIGELVQNIFLAESSDTVVMLALLNAVASLDYDTVRPHGQVLAIAALSNPAPEVKEAAIRVYETWGHAEGAKILANIECPWDWLDEYRKQVVVDLGGVV